MKGTETGMAKILAIDDERDTLTFITDVLGEKHEVITSESWLNAVESLIRDHFDLILLDIKMPGLSGDQVAEVLKKRLDHKQLKIVLFSGIDESELQRKAAAVGAKGYIHKPCPRDLFFLYVERFLRG